MRACPTIAAIVLLAVAVAACAKKEVLAAPDPKAGFAALGQKGRYVGVGVYSPGEAWTQLKPPLPASEAPPPNPRPAGLEDDDVVIVVTDTATGELRQCGNLSGHCVSLRPWAQRAESVAPAPLNAPIPKAASQPAGRSPEG